MSQDNGIHCWSSYESYADKLNAALQNKMDPDSLKHLRLDLEGALNIVKRMEKGEGDGDKTDFI